MAGQGREICFGICLWQGIGGLEEHRVCPGVRENVSQHCVLALSQHLPSLLYNCLKSSKLVSDIMR